SDGLATTVLEAGGMLRASEKSVVETAIGHRPGVKEVAANPVAQTATVTYDPTQTSVEELREWVLDCGYHCAGQSVPEHVCELIEPAEPHGEMSMDSMVADLRNRFLVAAVFSVPILLWSKIGADVFGFHAAPPFGLREDVFTLILSLPVIFYSCS